MAEEGDDISNLEAPKEEPQNSAPPAPPAPEPAKPREPQTTQHVTHHGPPPSHTRPLFPSVHRLVLEHGITNLDAIQGTGVRGMLTKGDILTYLGKASGPNGTYKPPISPIEEANKNRKPVEKEHKVRILAVCSSAHGNSLTRLYPLISLAFGWTGNSPRNCELLATIILEGKESST